MESRSWREQAEEHLEAAVKGMPGFVVVGDSAQAMEVAQLHAQLAIGYALLEVANQAQHKSA